MPAGGMGWLGISGVPVPRWVEANRRRVAHTSFSAHLWGSKILGSVVRLSFGMIVAGFFSGLYAAFRVLLALVVSRGSGRGRLRMSSCLFFGMRWRCCAGR